MSSFHYTIARSNLARNRWTWEITGPSWFSTIRGATIANRRRDVAANLDKFIGRQEASLRAESKTWRQIPEDLK